MLKRLYYDISYYILYCILTKLYPLQINCAVLVTAIIWLSGIIYAIVSYFIETNTYCSVKNVAQPTVYCLIHVLKRHQKHQKWF